MEGESSAIEEGLCPLCGQPNACALAARRGAAESDRDPCWCKAVTIPASVLERVPPEAKGRACICRRCAAGSGSAASDT